MVSYFKYCTRSVSGICLNKYLAVYNSTKCANISTCVDIKSFLLYNLDASNIFNLFV